MNEQAKINPLLGLIGIWEGNKGVDLAPKPEEDENNPYYETLTIEAVDTDIENAEEQELYAVKYSQVVREIANDKVSHDENGYWIWETNSDTIMCGFSIPRGVSVLAGGNFKIQEDDAVILKVSAEQDDPDWGIVQSPFMKKKAKTLDFNRELKLQGDTLSYVQEMTLDIYGKTFNHKDTNILTRVG